MYVIKLELRRTVTPLPQSTTKAYFAGLATGPYPESNQYNSRSLTIFSFKTLLILSSIYD
jgi:hypothetical protein